MTLPRLRPSIPANILQLKQQLLNQILRLRYVSGSLREEQLSLVVAHAIGPLRSSAAALLEIEGSAVDAPQQALERFGSELGLANWTETVGLLSALQDSLLAAPGKTVGLFFAILDLACRMLRRAEALAPGGAP